ncbi:MAG: hypothetical protein IIC78_06405 [Chloroflexi bacterium]|nr:hypothetical protein [Chloroflexota bacterium]
MDFYIIVLRIIHILAAVFWAGTAFFLAGFLEPTTQATAPESGKVMAHLAAKTRFSQALAWAAILVVLSGGLLYWRVSGGLNSNWLTSGTGIGLTIGAIAGIFAAGIGLSVSYPTIQKMVALGAEIARSGGPPTAEQQQMLLELQNKSRIAGQALAVLLVIATLGMATAQYLI